MRSIDAQAPTPAFNITSDGRLEWKQGVTNPLVQGSRHVAGKTDLEAGLAALNDGSNGGCTYVMCSWYGADATSYAGPCAEPLEDLGRIVRMQGWQSVPSCQGTSLVYAPVTCASPWQLVHKGDWQSYACRAMTALGPPPPPPPSPAEVTARRIDQYFKNHDAPTTPNPNGDCSWSVMANFWHVSGTIPINIQVDCYGNPRCYSDPLPVREYTMQACSGAEFREILNWNFWTYTLANIPPGFDGGGSL